MVNKPARPTKTMTLESGTELKMTYLMLNDLLLYVGGPDEAMQQILMNQNTRDLIIRRLLTDNRKPLDKIEELTPIEDIDVDIYEMDDILAWSLEHVMYFFMKTAEKLQAVFAKYPELQDKEKSKMLSDHLTNGSTPSPETTKSAGPTESDPANTAS